MLTIHTNILSNITQRSLNNSSNALKTSLERLSTGFKINKAADNASNLAISKNMNCQISSTNVAQENTLQAMGLLDTADAALGKMTDITNRIRDLSLQAMNGTYSDKERAMMQEEVNKLTLELYRQRNSTMYNKISVFGKAEKPPQTLMNTAIAPFSGGGATLKASTSGVSALSLGDEPAVASLEGATPSTASIEPTGANLDVSTLGPQGNVGTCAVEKLTEEEALAQGYTVIKTAEELVALNTNVANKKFILMGDIDLSGVEWTGKTLATGAEFNGNGYAISEFTSNRGLFSTNYGSIKNLNIVNANVNVGENDSRVGILVEHNTKNANIENCSVSGNMTATTRYIGGVAGGNDGSIKNCASSVNIEMETGQYSVGGLVGEAYSASVVENVLFTGTVNAQAGSVAGVIGCNYGTLKNSISTGDINGKQWVGGLVGNNNAAAATIENCSATGNVTGTGGSIGGLVGSARGTIKKSYATGDVTGNGSVGGFVGGFYGGGTITNSYSLGDVDSKGYSTGGFVGHMNNGTIIDSYSKGDVSSTGYNVGGFIGDSAATTDSIVNCYAVGVVSSNMSNVGGFVGSITNGLSVENSYTSATVNSTNATAGAFAGNSSVGKLNATNVYSNGDQPAGVVVEQAGVTAMPKDWFEDSENLQFLGSAYDYYYNPPEIKGNSESYASEFIKFQIGANEGKDNMLSLNLTFKMNFFSADVSSIEKASATLEKVDEFKQTLTEKRAEIGAARNRLESVIESQSVRLENLEASHSTMVDTDFAFEAANLTKMQILQNTTATLLAQANTLPSLALQLLE